MDDHISTIKGLNLEIIKCVTHWESNEIYLVKYGEKEAVLKCHHLSEWHSEQYRDRIIAMIKSGIPDNAFLWPLDVTEWKYDSFGIVMDLVGDGYHELTEFLRGTVKFKSWKMKIDVCLKIVTAFIALHRNGYCYQSLDDGNLFIDADTGKVKIVGSDDNIAPSGENLGILGKPRYMAPEIVRNENLPDTQSDRYSLAMILFMVICCGHPLEGREGTPPILTDAISTVIYGTNPVFIFDPDNDRNRPIPNIHKGVINIWNCLPDYMQDIFVRAFSHESLHQKRRVIEVDWIKALVRFRSKFVIK